MTSPKRLQDDVGSGLKTQADGPNPLRKQRSPWERHEDFQMVGVTAQRWHRRVHDGVLTALIGEEPDGWHLSISHAPTNPKRSGRYPTWDEIAHARYGLLPDDVMFAMLLPPQDEYVALHDTTFHLHEISKR